LSNQKQTAMGVEMGAWTLEGKLTA
jgi:hypothetical protein